MFVEVLILAALLIGVAIGKWYEHGRIGGTAHMRQQRDNARRACDRARAQRDQLLDLDQMPPTTNQPGPTHPSRGLQLVHPSLELRPTS